MKCRNCGAELDIDALFCTECGAKVEQEAHCKNCGAELETGSLFCANCGAKVKQPDQQPNQQMQQPNLQAVPQMQQPKKKRVSKKYGAFVIKVGAVAALAVGAVMLVKSMLPPDPEKMVAYQSDGILYYVSDMDKDKQPIEIDESKAGFRCVTISDDGTYLYYIDNEPRDPLYRVQLNKMSKNSKRNEKYIEEIGEEVTQYLAEKDGTVFYLSDDGMLSYFDGEQVEDLDTNVRKMQYRSGDLIFYTKAKGDHDQYYSYDAKEKKSNSYEEGNSIYRIDWENGVVYCRDEDKVYRTDRKGNEKQLADHVEMVLDLDQKEDKLYYLKERKETFKLYDFVKDDKKREDAEVLNQDWKKIYREYFTDNYEDDFYYDDEDDRQYGAKDINEDGILEIVLFNIQCSDQPRTFVYQDKSGQIQTVQGFCSYTEGGKYILTSGGECSRSETIYKYNEENGRYEIAHEGSYDHYDGYTNIVFDGKPYATFDEYVAAMTACLENKETYRIDTEEDMDDISEVWADYREAEQRNELRDELKNTEGDYLYYDLYCVSDGKKEVKLASNVLTAQADAAADVVVYQRGAKPQSHGKIEISSIEDCDDVRAAMEERDMAPGTSDEYSNINGKEEKIKGMGVAHGITASKDGKWLICHGEDSENCQIYQIENNRLIKGDSFRANYYDGQWNENKYYYIVDQGEGYGEFHVLSDGKDQTILKNVDIKSLRHYKDGNCMATKDTDQKELYLFDSNGAEKKISLRADGYSYINFDRIVFTEGDCLYRFTEEGKSQIARNLDSAYDFWCVEKEPDFLGFDESSLGD